MVLVICLDPVPFTLLKMSIIELNFKIVVWYACKDIELIFVQISVKIQFSSLLSI